MKIIMSGVTVKLLSRLPVDHYDWAIIRTSILLRNTITMSHRMTDRRMRQSTRCVGNRCFEHFVVIIGYSVTLFSLSKNICWKIQLWLLAVIELNRWRWQWPWIDNYNNLWESVQDSFGTNTRTHRRINFTSWSWARLASTQHSVANVRSNCDSTSADITPAAASAAGDLSCECIHSISVNFLTPPTYTWCVLNYMRHTTG